MKSIGVFLNDELVEFFDLENKRNLIWKLNDLSNQIASIKELIANGKSKMDTINLGPQDLNVLLELQRQKLVFIFRLLNMPKKEFDEYKEEFAAELCPSATDEKVCCEKHFLTWNKLSIMKDYGSD